MRSSDPTADWRRLAAGGDVLLASGDHADVLTEPNVRKVAEYLGG
jgi:thioesterase domain-containing protein